MSRVYTSKKSPFVAGILSLIPGLGQIYNEQTGKGLLMFILFVGTFLFFVLRISPFMFFPHNDFFPSLDFPGNPIKTVWVSPLDMTGLSRIYPLLWFAIMLPFFVVFSISDAVQNARRINFGFARAEGAPSGAPPTPPPGASPANTATDQDRLRTEAHQKMNDSAATGTFQPSMEEAMNTQNTDNANTNANAAAPPPKKARGISGKFLLGTVLMVIGGIYILEELNLSIFHWLSWNHIWPIIPLFFGLRLLSEYKRDKDRGQFVLGTGFTAIGAIFFLENWKIFRAWEFIEDAWMFIFFAIGALFVLIDLVERKRNG